MANPYINVYTNNPTAGGTDGTAVSTDGAFTAPISFSLDASRNESQTLPLAIRTQTGYKTMGTTVIQDQNDSSDRLKLCWTANGTFTDSISTTDEITATNKMFYARASSSDTETPKTDRSISLKVTCVIASV